MSGKALKVLQVGRDIDKTGGGKVILEVTSALLMNGCKVEILTDSRLSDSSKSSTITPFGEQLDKWKTKGKVDGTIRHLLQLVSFMVFGSIIAKEYKENGYVIINHNNEIIGGDILVFHNVFIAEWLQDKRKLLKKTYRFLNPVFTLRIAREWIMVRLKSTKSIIAVSPQTLQEVGDITPASKRKLVVYNGVNIEKFNVSKLDKSNYSFLNSGERLLLFVGYEFERKGLEYVVRALKLLPADVKLLVIGGRGSNIQKYEHLAEKLGLKTRVHFLGNRSDIAAFYQLAEVFILPSNYETWGLVGLEALASGTPILMTNTGGVQEYLNDGYNGYFIDQSPENIAEKALHILNDSSLLEELSKNARKTALNFSWEYIAREYLNEINNLISKEKSNV